MAMSLSHQLLGSACRMEGQKQSAFTGCRATACREPDEFRGTRAERRRAVSEGSEVVRTPDIPVLLHIDSARFVTLFES